MNTDGNSDKKWLYLLLYRHHPFIPMKGGMLEVHTVANINFSKTAGQ